MLAKRRVDRRGRVYMADRVVDRDVDSVVTHHQKATTVSMAFLERTYLFGAPLSAFVTDLPTNPFSALLPWSKHGWVCSMAEETPIKTADLTCTQTSRQNWKRRQVMTPQHL